MKKVEKVKFWATRTRSFLLFLGNPGPIPALFLTFCAKVTEKTPIISREAPGKPARRNPC